MLFSIWPFSSPNPWTTAASERSLQHSAAPQKMKHGDANSLLSAGTFMTACDCFQPHIQVSLWCVCAADEMNPVKLIQEFKISIWLASCSMKSISRPRFGINSENFLKQLNIFQFTKNSDRLEAPTLPAISAFFFSLFLTLLFLFVFFKHNWQHTLDYEGPKTKKSGNAT